MGRFEPTPCLALWRPGCGPAHSPPGVASGRLGRHRPSCGALSPKPSSGLYPQPPPRANKRLREVQRPAGEIPLLLVPGELPRARRAKGRRSEGGKRGRRAFAVPPGRAASWLWASVYPSVIWAWLLRRTGNRWRIFPSGGRVGGVVVGGGGVEGDTRSPSPMGTIKCSYQV